MENDSSSSMGPKEVIKKTQEQLLFQIPFATQSISSGNEPKT